MLLTANERKVLRMLATSAHTEWSINGVARQCGVSAGGAYKILKKLEQEGIVGAKLIANIKAYKLQFTTKARRVLELAMIPDALEGRVRMRADDLDALREHSIACIIFGSYARDKKQPRDIDVLVIVDRDGYPQYRRTLRSVQERTPLKIHDVVQTPDDLLENLRTQDPVVIAAVRQGIVLWGADTIVEVLARDA